MLLRLAEQLDVPLRERNALLVAAGFAPAFQERPLEHPALGLAKKAVDLVLAGHEPYPALAIDRRYTLLASNTAVPPLIAGASPRLLEPPVNLLRLTLHPEGLAHRIANLAEWQSHLLGRLRRQIQVTQDPALSELLAELLSYPAPPASGSGGQLFGDLVVPLRFQTEAGILSFFSTTTVFGTPVEVTLSEIAIESFFPADSRTAEILRRPNQSGSSAGNSPAS
jgi:hypothetical protein